MNNGRVYFDRSTRVSRIKSMLQRISYEVDATMKSAVSPLQNIHLKRMHFDRGGT